MRMRMSFMGALLIGSVLVTPALAQTVDFKKALPEGTIAYVGMPDIETSLQEMQDGALARMWRESEVQDFFADLLALAEVEWDMIAYKRSTVQAYVNDNKHTMRRVDSPYAAKLDDVAFGKATFDCLESVEA